MPRIRASSPSTSARAQELWMYNPGLTALEDDPGVEIVPVSRRTRGQQSEPRPHPALAPWMPSIRRLGTVPRRGSFTGRSTRPPRNAPRTPSRNSPDAPSPIGSSPPEANATTPSNGWSHSRYQEVVDPASLTPSSSYGSGAPGSHSPLRGVVDLRGRTSIRELILWMSRPGSSAASPSSRISPRRWRTRGPDAAGANGGDRWRS